MPQIFLNEIAYIDEIGGSGPESNLTFESIASGSIEIPSSVARGTVYQIYSKELSEGDYILLMSAVVSGTPSVAGFIRLDTNIQGSSGFQPSSAFETGDDGNKLADVAVTLPFHVNGNFTLKCSIYNQINNWVYSGWHYFHYRIYKVNSDNKINYSTEEHVVGTWIDGKTLYEKTVVCGQLPASGNKIISHGIANVDYIFVCGGDAVRPTDQVSIPLPFVSIANSAVSVYANTANIIIEVEADRSAFTQSNVTLRYTRIEN